MSVTFSIEDTPFVETTCEDGGYTWKESSPAEGWLVFNMSNINAYDFFMLLNRQNDAKRLYGTWTVPELSNILMLLRKLNSIEFEKETKVNGNIVECGRDKAYVTGRLGQMRKLVELGISKQKPVVFG